jgi:hypothetical protein
MSTASAETAAVETYQIRQYERLGFSHDDALLAISQKIDWHDVEDLLRRGCPSDLALAILAPLS